MTVLSAERCPLKGWIDKTETVTHEQKSIEVSCLFQQLQF